MTGTELASEGLGQRIKARIKRMLGNRGVFLEGFLKHPVMVGAIFPSSRHTIDQMLAPVDWDNCKVFVEYGPGVGTFCQPVLDRLRGDACLIVIDTNPEFIDHLRRTITDSRFTAVLDSAADVQEILRTHGHQQADYALSGLPFSTLPEGVGPAIAQATHNVLREGGAFLVYQYTSAARQFMARHFERIDSGIELRNLPPCKLYWGWKDKPAD